MTSTKPSRKWLFTGLIALAAGALFFIGYRQNAKWKKEHVLVVLKPIQTAKGWGYDITSDGRIFIHQDVIPAIGGDVGFRTKEDALAVGQKVYDRIMKGDVPMVTAKEVRDMGIIPNASTRK